MRIHQRLTLVFTYFTSPSAASTTGASGASFAGPTPTGSLQLRTWSAVGRFHLELKDAGGPVPPTLLPGAFEPFGELHASPVKGVRAPGQDLPACHQLLAVYHGEMDLRNEDEGTVVHVAFPLR